MKVTSIRAEKTVVTKEACEATMRHVAIIAKALNKTNIYVFNALLMGEYRKELGEIL